MSALTPVEINLQNKAKAMMDAKEAATVARETVKKLKEEFVAAMRQATKSEIIVDGKKFELDLKEEYKVKVSKV